MARQIDVEGMLAVGNGEPCPFCVEEDNRYVDDIFINQPDNNLMEHMINEHPSELNKALFKEPPPKPWLEQPFQVIISKIFVELREINNERVDEERYKEIMHAIYCDLQEHFGG